MNSIDLFKRASEVIPGGVNSPVRSFSSVGGDPIYVTKGEGAEITTVEGRKLIDFCGSWGPLILGHAPENIIKKINQTVQDGTTFGINTPLEVELAELICSTISSIDMVRLVNSGTEAVMSAIRLARGFTKRTKIVKFQGCYHGHSDSLLVSAGSGLLTGGQLSSEGVPQTVVDDIIVIPYNDKDAVKNIFEKSGNDIAAVIVEPIAGNMGLIKPDKSYLEVLRSETEKSGSVLIFDEVITGFRFGPTTYGDICGIEPDLTTLGKIIGGGMPIGAVGGRKDIMECLAPLGGVYQAGTLSGNPVAVAAGIETLNTLINKNPYQRISDLGVKLKDGMDQIIKNCSAEVVFKCESGVFTPFFTNREPENYNDVALCNTDAFANYFKGMLEHGIYTSPSQYEVNFISATHDESHIDAYLSAAKEILS